MPRLSLWDKRKRHDYKFFDRVISEQFFVGGTTVFLHKYIGPVEGGVEGDATQPYIPEGETNEQTIQDLLFLENRDRRYDESVYEMRGIYTVTDADFDLRQFGLFLQNDTLFISFHYNDMIDILGRKIMAGDVIELPHLRDDALLDEESDGISSRPAVNKFYKVTDASRSSEGFSPTWYYHIWRIKVSPLTDSQEYADILDREVNEDGSLGDRLTGGSGTDPTNPNAGDGFGGTGQSLRDIISNYQDEIGISEAIKEQAAREVPERNFQTAHFYVVPGDEFGIQFPWVFAGDGEPPNGAIPLGSGDDFPDDAKNGDYWLRTDFEPNVLYQKSGTVWRRVEVDYRKKWSAAHRILETFINNNTQTDLPQESFDEKTALSKAIKPKTDL